MQERNWEEAERRAHHALELEPTNTPAAFLLEHIYSYQGRHDQAVLMAERTHELDPVSPIYNSVEAQTLLYAGQVEDALQKALTARDHDENFWHVHFMLARIYAEKDMYKEAIVAADRAEQPSADHSYVLAVKGYALARSGAEVEARAIVDQLLERTQSARPNTHAALVYTGLGDKQKALEHLEIGFENGELQFDLKAAPAWDDLRSEPRFIELLRKWRLD